MKRCFVATKKTFISKDNSIIYYRKHEIVSYHSQKCKWNFFFYCQFLLESDKSREKKFSEIASFLVFFRVHKTFTLRKISGKIIKIFSFTLNQQWNNSKSQRKKLYCDRKHKELHHGDFNTWIVTTTKLHS